MQVRCEGLHTGSLLELVCLVLVVFLVLDLLFGLLVVNRVGTGCSECQKNTSNIHSTSRADLLPAPEGMTAIFIVGGWTRVKGPDKEVEPLSLSLSLSRASTKVGRGALLDKFVLADAHAWRALSEAPRLRAASVFNPWLPPVSRVIITSPSINSQTSIQTRSKNFLDLSESSRLHCTRPSITHA